MQVVRDLLDKQVIDHDGRELGRVDGILVDCSGAPPRLSAILIGASVLGERLHPRIGRVLAAIERMLGLAGERPVRIDFADLEPIGHDIIVDAPSARVAADAAEHGLRVWLMKIRGGR